MSIPKKIVFLDIDGVMTSFGDTPGSYITHGEAGYGISPSCFNRLKKLLEDEDAKVIISSNWRKFDDDGPRSFWISSYGRIQNPLPKLRAMLGDLLAGELPKVRHMVKSNVLSRWMEDNNVNETNTKFVVFDDDPDEGFQMTEDFNIKNHFIMTKLEMGLTDDDVKRAKEILNA